MRNAEQVANILVELYGTHFGGKHGAKFLLCYEGMRAVAGRQALRDVFLDEIQDVMQNRGYRLIRLGAEFAVVRERYLLNLRPVPRRIWDQYLADRSNEVVILSNDDVEDNEAA